MMKTAVVTFLVVLAAVASAGEIENLWPDGKMPDPQAHQQALPVDRENDPDFRKGERQLPYLEWCDAPAASNRTGSCMILISGGGYFNWCDVDMVNGWEKRLTALGVQCVKLVYRTPRPEGLPIYQSAWEDGQRAVRLVRSEAAKRGFDPERIGAMSMSAGSHLALLLATSAETPAYAPIDEIDRISCHLDWAAPNAIAYALTDGIGHPNTTGGNGPDVKLDDIFRFDAKTCSVSMAHGGNDEYSPIASTLVYRKLRERRIPAEVHLYPDKGHGAYGLERHIEFMRQMGWLGRLEPEVKLLDRYADDSDRASYEKHDLWPEGKIPSYDAKQNVPYLEWHLPKNRRSDAIFLIYSGGSYVWNSPDCHEVAPARRRLNQEGCTVVTMSYRVPPTAGAAKHLAAWQDLQRAIRVVRSQARSRGLDPNRICIMGSSAGGHLTLLGVTSSTESAYEPIDEIDRLPCNVQLAVAIYPAYALTDGVDRENAFGGNRDEDVLVSELKFDAMTVPTLFVHGDADGWAAMNSVKCWERMRRMGVQSEVHTLATRVHCFHRDASPGTGSYTVLERILEFAKAKGFIR